MMDKFSLPADGVIAILRRVPESRLLAVADSLYSGGIRAMECTFDQVAQDCESALARALDLLVSRYGDSMLIGAGTVLSAHQVQIAADHGARIIISPNVDVSVVAKTKLLGLLSAPGAMTPSEAVAAVNAGADYVKLFPASNLGPEYLKAIAAPLSHIRFLAVGGIDETNVAVYKKAGAVGFGIGSVLTPKDAIASGDYAVIKQRAARILRALS